MGHDPGGTSRLPGTIKGVHGGEKVAPSRVRTPTVDKRGT